MTLFGSARDVSKFESSKSAGFTRFEFKTVLQDVSVATDKPFKKKTFWRKPLYQSNSPLRKQPNEATVQVWNISERAK